MSETSSEPLCSKCGRTGRAHPYHEMPPGIDRMVGLPPVSPEIAAMNDGCCAFRPAAWDVKAACGEKAH